MFDDPGRHPRPASHERGGNVSAPKRFSNALVIVNPTSGRRDSVQVAAVVSDRLAAAGLQAKQRHTTAAGDAMRWTVAAARRGFDLVVAVGGDGTLAEVVSGATRADRRVPVAHVPAGTANIAARSLAIPAVAEQAAEAILQGRPTRFDVGYAPAFDRHFLIAAAVGFPARLVRDAPKELKQRVGVLAYAIGAARNLRRVVNPVRVEIEFDGHRRTFRSHTVVASNLGAEVAVPLDPHVDPHDGCLQLTVVTARTVRDVIGLLVRLLFRRRRDPRVIRFTARSVRITAHPPQPVHIDGEMLGRTPVVLEVVPGAVELVVPEADSTTRGATAIRSGTASFTDLESRR
jgi:diacylglycerol kinase (ATP)